jgi:chitodextrinase
VTALDAAGNESPASAALSVTTPAAPDTTPPTQPGSFAVSSTTDTSVSLSWTASTDNVGVDHYELSRNGTLIASPTGTSYTDTGRAPSTLYSYSLVAVDAAGNKSTAATLNATTAPDTNAPTPPSSLSATSVTASQVQLSWSGASDDVAVTGYRIYRNGTQIGSSTTMSFTDTTVAPSTSYSYTVTALDAAGNESPQSAALPVTTPAAGATLFSDGFESGTLAAWTNINNLTAEQALNFSGAWGARATSTAGTAAFAYGPLSSTATTVTYSLEFLIVSQGANNINLLRLRTANGGSLGAVYVTSTDRLALRNDIANVSTTSTTTVSQGVWHSLSVQFVVGDTTGSSESVTLDGVPVTPLSRTDTLGTTPIGIVQLGESATGRNFDVAYDDIRVTTP